MGFKVFLGLSIVILNFSSCTQLKDSQVFSPDGKVKITLHETDDALEYALYWNDKEVIKASEISLFPGRQARIISGVISEVEGSWKPVWGQFSVIENHFIELKLELDYEGITAVLFVRAYDNGVGFRFETENVGQEYGAALLLDYHLSDEDQIYMPAGEKEPLGPLQIHTLIQSDAPELDWQMPIVIETQQGPYLSFLESDLVSNPGFEVINFSFDKKRKRITSSNKVLIKEGKFSTPWRVILLEENLGDLVTNTTPLNLATPNKLSNTSFIKPGKAVWDWRVHGYRALDGFVYGINTESYLRFIDFASLNDIEYFLIDDAWYTDIAKDTIFPSPHLDMNSISAYATEKGVSLILYYDRRKGEYGDENLFSHYQSLGMSGIKYGFMGSNVPFTREAIRLSSESELLINFHDGPVPMTGVSRTYPNAITREYNHAQQDSRRTFTPETFIKMALVNAIQGPLDMNNGIFDINGTNAGLREKGPLKLNSLHTTVVGEAARTLIVFSGIICLPDAPEAYQEKKDLFEFIKKLPIGKWDETLIINAKMGEYITTARRAGKEWFVGSVHSKGGELDIPLDFLEEGVKYRATFYMDTNKTNSKTNPEAYKIREGNLEKEAIAKAYIAEGGGHCMWIRPI